MEKHFDALHNREGKTHNVSIVSAYTKTMDKPFQIPFQGRYVNDIADELKDEYSDTNVDVRQKDHTSATY